MVLGLLTGVRGARRLLWFSLALWGWSLSSCFTQDTSTQVMVMVTVDPALAEQVDVVHFEVIGTAGSENDILIEPGRDLSATGNPVQISLLPDNKDATLHYTLLIQLEAVEGEDRRIISEQTISAGYFQNEFREVWMHFDDECEHQRCPGDYRCQVDAEGAPRCVEYCVVPRVSGDVTPSTPVPCGETCETPGCDGDDIVSCDPDGFSILERRCGFGCANDQCLQMTPSNVPEVEFMEGLQPLVISHANAVLSVFHGGDRGSYAVLTTGEEEICVLCDDPPCTCEQDMACAECEEQIDEFGFQMVDGGVACDEGNSPYAVIRMERLHVLEGATLAFRGNFPIIMLVDDDVIADGTITASAQGLIPGPSGCSSLLPPPGPGAGSGGEGVAGGGGSYGGVGGEGGHPLFDVGHGGEPGMPYPLDEDPTLIPLRGGSAGGPNGEGGGGGGALQISTNGSLRIGRSGILVSGGAGGLAAIFGGGGGSGGSLLLESGALVCQSAEVTRAHVGAPGGGGGSILGREVGAAGSPAAVPARGGETGGGAGSDVAGNGSPGTRDPLWNAPGGGGGGAGRVRINTKECLTEESYADACGLVLKPISFGMIGGGDCP